MLSRFSSRLTAAAVTRVLGASTVVSQPTHFTVVNMSTTSSVGPIQQRMEEKIRAALSPTELIIENESHLHRHHAPMQGVNSTETHFR
jgi:stress-induced morphogen